MKISKYHILLSLGAILFMTAGCDKNNYLCYDTDTAYVKFEYPSAGNDSTVFSFRLHPTSNEETVEIPVKLMGLSSTVAREISAEAIAEESTAVEGTDFVIEHSEIPADSISGKLKVKVRRTEALNESPRSFTIKLKSNDYFGEAPVDRAKYKIVITNELIAPEGWIFDDYSQVKHEFVIEHTGVATNYETLWTASEITWWKNILINALYEYNKAHPGDPLKDENGMTITF